MNRCDSLLSHFRLLQVLLRLGVLQLTLANDEVLLHLLVGLRDVSVLEI